MTFGQMILKARRERSVKLVAVAKAAQIDVSYLSRIERGERHAPSREIVLAIARALQLSRHDTDHLLQSADYDPTDPYYVGTVDKSSTAVSLSDQEQRLLSLGQRASSESLELAIPIAEEVVALIDNIRFNAREKKLMMLTGLGLRFFLHLINRFSNTLDLGSNLPEVTFVETTPHAGNAKATSINWDEISEASESLARSLVEPSKRHDTNTVRQDIRSVHEQLENTVIG